MKRNKLHEARKRANLTQAQLAEKLGVNRATVSKYENGEISPTIEQLFKIASILNVSALSLLDADNPDDAEILEGKLSYPLKSLASKLNGIDGKIESVGNHFCIVYGGKRLAVSADDLEYLDTQINRQMEFLLDFLAECDNWRLGDCSDDDLRLRWFLD